MIEIYTDGGCDPNPGIGAWAFVKIDKNTNQVTECNGRSVEVTTNNRMEYTAMIEALKSVNKSDEVEIYTDSMLLVNTMNSWMYQWERKGWPRKKKNLDLVKQLFELMKNRNKTEIYWVRGHNGNFYNERADYLCAKLIKEYYRENRIKIPGLKNTSWLYS